jgi:hypothetical protein
MGYVAVIFLILALVIGGTIAFLWVSSAEERLAMEREKTRQHEIDLQRSTVAWYGIKGLTQGGLPYFIGTLGFLLLAGILVLTYTKQQSAPPPQQLPPVNVNIALLQPGDQQPVNRGEKLALLAKSGIDIERGIVIDGQGGTDL